MKSFAFMLVTSHSMFEICLSVSHWDYAIYLLVCHIFHVRDIARGIARNAPRLEESIQLNHASARIFEIQKPHESRVFKKKNKHEGLSRIVSEHMMLTQI